MIANQQYVFPIETEPVRFVQTGFGGEASIPCVARRIAAGNRWKRPIGDPAYPVVARIGDVYTAVPGDR